MIPHGGSDFIDRIREKVGVMYGNPEVTPGGRALKFYTSLRLDIRRIAAIKEGDSHVGNRTRVRVVKNKVAPPFKDAEFDILYGAGISFEGELLDIGLEADIIQKSGAWYSYGDMRLGQGRENARQFLTENSALKDEIAKAVRSFLGLATDGEAAPAETADAEESA